MSHLRDRHVVVCVDDEPPVLRALERLFRREAFELLCTVRPRQALDWVQERDVSLILADRRMPDLDGAELLDQVRRARPETTRAVLTAYPDDVALTGSGSTPIQHALLKSWDDDQLRRAVRRLLKVRDLEEAEADRNGPD